MKEGFHLHVCCRSSRLNTANTTGEATAPRAVRTGEEYVFSFLRIRTAGLTASGKEQGNMKTAHEAEPTRMVYLLQGIETEY